MNSVVSFEDCIVNWSWDKIAISLIRVVNQDPQQHSDCFHDQRRAPGIVQPKERPTSGVVHSLAGRPLRGMYLPPGPLRGTLTAVYVLPVQGGEPHLVTEGPYPNVNLFDWTADGRYLVESSVRNSIVSPPTPRQLPVKDGAANGEPILIQPGRLSTASTTKDGRLIYRKAKPGRLWPVHLASMDEAGRPGNWRKLDLAGENYDANPWPHLSPDGTRVVYTAQDVDAASGNSVVRVRDFATGKDREIYRSHDPFMCVWATRQAKVFL